MQAALYIQPALALHSQLASLPAHQLQLLLLQLKVDMLPVGASYLLAGYDGSYLLAAMTANDLHG